MVQVKLQASAPFDLRCLKNLLMGSAAFAALAFMPNHAFATDECGVAVPGGTITCDGDGTPASDVNPYAGGITYINVDGLTLNVNGAATTINSGANSGILVTGNSANILEINTAATLAITTSRTGISARQLGTGAFTVNNASSITLGIGSSGNRGIDAQQFGLGALTVSSTGNISTSENSSIGIVASINNAANTQALTLNMSNSTISTTGESAGINVSRQGDGIIDVDISGNISTTANNAIGLFVQNATGASAYTIDTTGGLISTLGRNAHGIVANYLGTGTAEITTAGRITTGGRSAAGIIANSVFNNGDIRLVNSGTIATTGFAADAIILRNSNVGAMINATSSGNLNTTGDAGRGISAQVRSALEVNVTGGTISTTGAGASGISLRVDDAGNLTLNSAANISTTGATVGFFTAGGGASAIRAETSKSGAISITASGSLSTQGNVGHGILARHVLASSSGAITINSTATISVAPGAVAASQTHGIFAETFNSAAASNVRINATGGSITVGGTGGSSNFGILLTQRGTGIARLTSAIDITTTSNSGAAIRSGINNAASTSTNTIIVSGGSLSTAGPSAFGINGGHSGLGAISISSAATIATTGSGATGILAFATNALNANNINIGAGGSITTGGSSAFGIEGRSSGVGATFINSTADITTSGFAANAIFIRMDNASNAAVANVNANGGTILTTGVGATGIRVTHAGTGTINILSAASLTATGGGAHGIAASRTGAGAINITVSGVVSSAAGDGIQTLGNANDLSTITLNAGANVSSGSGRAIFNDEGDSNVTVNTGASVTSGIFLFDGDDNLTFAGGSFAGVTVMDGGDDIFVGDGFIDTLTFAGSSGTLTGANVRNWERIIVGAGSTISFTDAALTAGLTTINNGGRFDAGNGFALSSDLTLNTGGIFDATGGGAGIFSLIGLTNNAGTISTQDGVAGDRLTFEGAYTGNGGRIHIDTVLGDDTSVTDLITANNGTAGTTTLNVRNAGGTGDFVVNGIKVIEVNGASNGTFVLDGDHLTPNGKQAVVGGAFSYRLEKQGNGNWHLISSLTPAVVATAPLFQPGSPVYEAYPQVLQALNAGQSYYQRVGSKYSAFDNGEPQIGDGTTSASSTNGPSREGQRGPFWGKVSGQYAHVEPDLSTTSTRYNIRSGKMQLGIDMLAHEGASGKLFFGITGQYGFANADISSVFGNGSIKTKAYGLGITSTWIAQNGFYLDGQTHFNWFNSDLNSDTLGRLASDNDGFGQSWSLEAGMPIETGNGWMVTPQAQLTWSNIRFDQFIGRSGELVSLNDGDSLIGRLGISVAHDRSWTGDDGSISRGHFYGIANIYHQFEDGTEAIVTGTSLFNRQDDLSGEIGVGFNVSWAQDKFSLYGDATASTSLENTGDSYAYGGTVGFKMRF